MKLNMEMKVPNDVFVLIYQARMASFMIFLERTAFLLRFLLDEEKQKRLYKHN